MKLTPTQRALVHVHITGNVPGRIHIGTYRAALEMCEVASTIRVSMHSDRHIWQLSSKGREFMADVPGIVGADYLQDRGFVLHPYQTRDILTSYRFDLPETLARAYLYPKTGNIGVYGNGILKPHTEALSHAELLKWRDTKCSD